jgi:hypothetical protein
MPKQARSDNDIRKLAQHCVDGKVYGTWFGERSTEAFPQMQHGSDTVQRLREEGIVHVFEYLELALPEKVDGIPRFGTFKTLDAYDAARLDQAIHRLTRHKTGR